MACRSEAPSPLAGEGWGEGFAAVGTHLPSEWNLPAPFTPNPSPARGEGSATGSRSEHPHAEG